MSQTLATFNFAKPNEAGVFQFLALALAVWRYVTAVCTDGIHSLAKDIHGYLAHLRSSLTLTDSISFLTFLLHDPTYFPNYSHIDGSAHISPENWLNSPTKEFRPSLDLTNFWLRPG